jgi:hypothetical protein
LLSWKCPHMSPGPPKIGDIGMSRNIPRHVLNVMKHEDMSQLLCLQLQPPAKTYTLYVMPFFTIKTFEGSTFDLSFDHFNAFLTKFGYQYILLQHDNVFSAFTLLAEAQRRLGLALRPWDPINISKNLLSQSSPS